MLFRSDSTSAATVDGRPCLDVRRSGTNDPSPPPGANPTMPLKVQEFVRACHLQDARGPDLGVVMLYMVFSTRGVSDFDQAARAFADNVTLPPRQAHPAPVDPLAQGD